MLLKDLSPNKIKTIVSNLFIILKTLIAHAKINMNLLVPKKIILIKYTC